MMGRLGMEQLWIEVCNRGFAAGWLILAIMVFRLIFRNGPKRIRLYLWALVALRLLCPMLPESSFSLVPSADVIPARIGTMEEPAIESGVELVDELINPVLGEYMPAVGFASINPIQVVLGWSMLIWMVGAAVLLAYSALADIRLRIRLRDAVLIGSKELYGVKGEPFSTVPIYASEKVFVPFTAGIGRPRIYLPYSVEDETKEHVIAHEMAHISHRDPWIKMLGWMLVIVFWFCPLMWLGWFLFERDMELACDERVVRGMSKDGRCSYTEALLSCSIGRKREPVGPLAFGAGDVKARVKSVLQYRRPTFWAVLAAAAACIVFVLCFATDPVGSSIDLPKKENIMSAQVGVMLENDSSFTPVITDISRIEPVLQAMEGAKKTVKSSVSDEPSLERLDGRSYAWISWFNDNYREEKWYFYSIGGTYYLEEPYGGIYKTDSDCFEAFAELAADIGDRQEWVSFTWNLLCFHADGEVERSETLGGGNAEPLHEVINAYGRKLISSGVSEQRRLKEKWNEEFQDGMGPELAAAFYDRDSVDLLSLDSYYRISWRNNVGGPENMLYVYEIDGEPYMHEEEDTDGAFLLERELYENMVALITK